MQVGVDYHASLWLTGILKRRKSQPEAVNSNGSGRWPWSCNGAPEGKDSKPKAKPFPAPAWRSQLCKTRLCREKGTSPRVHL